MVTLTKDTFCRIYSIEELIFQNPSFSLKICTALGFISYNSETDHKSKILDTPKILAQTSFLQKLRAKHAKLLVFVSLTFKF